MNIKREETERGVKISLYDTDEDVAHYVRCRYVEWGAGKRIAPTVRIDILAFGGRVISPDTLTQYIADLAEVARTAHELQAEMTARYAEPTQ